jgi:hypothetical protein
VSCRRFDEDRTDVTPQATNDNLRSPAAIITWPTIDRIHRRLLRIPVALLVRCPVHRTPAM